MPSFITGEPAAVQAVLPSVLPIASTTFATPIVVTTSSPHGLAPGDYFACYNATDPNANSLWKAGTCTPTTVVLLVPATGANSVGTLAGAAAGTLAPAGYGETFSIPSDLTDARDAASVNVAFEALADRTAWLLFTTNYLLTIKAGGSMIVRALGGVIGEAGSLFSGVFDFIDTGLVKMRGRRSRGIRQPLTDADHTVLVTGGNRFLLADNPAAPRTITLKSTGTVPTANETLDFICNNINTPGAQYTFIREDTTVICTFTGTAVTSENRCCAEFEFASGAWHLGFTSGSAYDGTDDYGVIPNVTGGGA